MLAGSDRYWNPVFETMPLEQLREVQLRKFRGIVSWAYDHSRLHRALYDEAGFHPDHRPGLVATPRSCPRWRSP